jgi:hypothetical protein
MLISVNLKRKYDLAVFRHPSTEPDPQIQALLSPFVGRYDSEMAASLYQSWLERKVQDPAFKAILLRYKDVRLVLGCVCNQNDVCHITILNGWLDSQPEAVVKSVVSNQPPTEIPNDPQVRTSDI